MILNPYEVPMEKPILFEEYCPLVERKVILYTKTWAEHIINKRGLAVSNCLTLVREMICKEHNGVKIYQKLDDLQKISFQIKTHYFGNRNSHLRIALKIINKTTAIITTVIPVNEYPTIGVKAYDSIKSIHI